MKVPFYAPLWARANENWPLCSQRTKSFPGAYLSPVLPSRPRRKLRTCKKWRQKEDAAWKQPCAQNRAYFIPRITKLHQWALIRAVCPWRLPLYTQTCYKKTVLPPKSLKLKDSSKRVQRSHQCPQTSSQIMTVIRQMEIRDKEHDLLPAPLLASKNFSRRRGRNRLSILLYNISSVRTEPVMTQQGVLYFTHISDAIDSRWY